MIGDDGEILGAVIVVLLQIVAGLVSALLSISRLTLTGHRYRGFESAKKGYIGIGLCKISIRLLRKIPLKDSFGRRW